MKTISFSCAHKRRDKLPLWHIIAPPNLFLLSEEEEEGEGEEEEEKEAEEDEEEEKEKEEEEVH